MWENPTPDELKKRVGAHIGRFGEGGLWENFKQKGATIMNHDNTQESAHKIIQLIVSRSKDLKTRPLLHGGLTGNNGGSFTTTPFGEELRAQLEESSDLTYKQLREHRNEEPSKEERRSTDPDVRWRCAEWDKEVKELGDRLKAQQNKLKRMDRIIVSRLIETQTHMLANHFARKLRLIGVFAKLFW